MIQQYYYNRVLTIRPLLSFRKRHHLSGGSIIDKKTTDRRLCHHLSILQTYNNNNNFSHHHHRLDFSLSFSTKVAGPTAAEEALENKHPKVRLFLQETYNIDPTLHDGIITALQSVFGKEIHISHLESFGANGMEALAQSVQQELQQQQLGGIKSKKRPYVPITVSIPHHKTEYENVQWKLGDSLLQLAKQSIWGDEYMTGTCGGNMSCCTCHVYLPPTLYEAVDAPPVEAELDMLDLAYEPKEDCSRLGCQVILTPSLLEKAKVKSNNNKNDDKEIEFRIILPSGINDVWN